LYVVNPDNSTTLADGVREVFDNSYAAAIDNNDAKKITGFDLNLGISSNNEILSVEKRPLPSVNDGIVLNLASIAVGNYQFEVQPSNFSSASVFVYIRDSYLDTYSPVDLNGPTKFSFTITNDAASFASNRFSIVFTKTIIAPAKPLFVIYPNPVQNGNIKVMMNNMPKGIYNVRVINTAGQTVATKQIIHSEGSSVETIGINTIKGTYMLEITKPDNTRFLNKIIVN
jgi:hypothetical protein